MEIVFSLGAKSPRDDSLQKDHLKRLADTSFNNHSPNWEVDNKTLPRLWYTPVFLQIAKITPTPCAWLKNRVNMADLIRERIDWSSQISKS